MRKLILTMAALAMVASVTSEARADGMAVKSVRQARHVCHGSGCGPYTPCRNCRAICPDGYSCSPLYGAYGPYGGTAYWGGFTYTGWGYR